MAKLLAPLLLLFSINGHAELYCYNGHLGAGMEWLNGAFTYTNASNAVINAPGVDIDPMGTPNPYGSVYCWANGAELTYIEQHLDVRTRVRASSVQPWQERDQTVYWTDADAMFIWNQYCPVKPRADSTGWG